MWRGRYDVNNRTGKFDRYVPPDTLTHQSIHSLLQPDKRK